MEDRPEPGTGCSGCSLHRCCLSAENERYSPGLGQGPLSDSLLRLWGGLGGRDPSAVIWTPLPCVGLELQL